MAVYELQCPSCGASIELNLTGGEREVKCPSCLTELELEFDASESVADTMAEANDNSVAHSLPERMKANRAIAGQVCGHCGEAMNLGDDVFNCQNCFTSTHLSCRESRNACSNPDCTDYRLAAMPGQAAPQSSLQLQTPVSSAPLQSGPAMKECVVCGEQILAGASKCRYCNEYQSTSARDRKKRLETSSGPAEALTVWEILACIFCSGIACIYGLIIAIQGRKKGWKIVMIAIVVQLILGAIRGLLEATQ